MLLSCLACWVPVLPCAAPRNTLRPAALQAWWLLSPAQPYTNWQDFYPAMAFVLSCMRYTGRGGMPMPGGQLIMGCLRCTGSGASQRKVLKPDNLDGNTSVAQDAAVEFSGLLQPLQHRDILNLHVLPCP